MDVAGVSSRFYRIHFCRRVAGGAIAVAVAVTIFYSVMDNVFVLVTLGPVGNGLRTLGQITRLR